MPLAKSTDAKSVKFCVDCKHSRPHGSDYMCKSPKLDYIDLVTGQTHKHVMSCKDLRGYAPCDKILDHCGVEGRWFEPMKSGYR